MASELSDQEMREALETCASEPVHIPGCIQPFGCMLAVTAETGRIAYVSENAEAFIGRPPRALLGADASDALGRELWHGVRNAAARSGLAERAVAIGAYEIQGQFCDIRVFASGGCLVVEMEPAADPGIDGNDALSTLGYLMFQIQACTQEQRLFELTVELMRHLSGYDRVLIYRFDREFNGEVLAEAKSAPLEGFLGLRFPHWDIPSQAREIMKKVPLRLISDVEQVPVPILSAPGGAPLDITLAASRGVSPVHMEYLRNMGSGATMTLSIMVEEKLWGIISFHHRRPKLAPSGLREVLVNFLAVFNGKLLALRQQAALGRIEMLDRGFVGDEAETLPLQDLLPSVAPVIMEVMNGHGFAVVSKSAPTTSGIVPGPEVLQALSDLAISRDEVIAIESLSERFPHYEASLNTVAGALLVGVLPDRAICIFRNELAQEVSWAGSPEKRVETVGDRLRLSPRGSFSVFLEEVRGRCEPWTQNDLYLIRHIRTLLHAAERQAVMDTLNRQQTLMIGELNHRVRNILALVRSVSRQARRRYGSLNSYANAIENRIRALAAAHDIGGGKFTQPVSLRQLIQVEFEPFRTITDQQAVVQGADCNLKPEIAPIFSLVIHELTTNAAKYGALSIPSGRVTVTLEDQSDGVAIHWVETGGPSVVQPNELGFGMAMIERAVPHELGGTADVRFDPGGLRAAFTLPAGHFSPEGAAQSAPIMRAPTDAVPDIPAAARSEWVLVLEDNFIIAKEMADQILDLGFAEARMTASVEEALDVLAQDTPGLAVLDVNLGPGRTSAPVALKLVEMGIPLVFVTGYGENAELPAELGAAPRLTKPITASEFTRAVAPLLRG